MTTEYQRIIDTELKPPRFCPTCNNLIFLKFREYRFPKILFACPICGEIVLVIEKELPLRTDR